MSNLDPALAVVGNLSSLPGSANNVANCNSLPFTQDPLVTGGGRQYGVWISGRERAPLVAWRDLPAGDWSAPVNLSAFDSTPFATAAALDPHHSFSLGVDSAGGLHVAGDHHNGALRYARSDPRDPCRWNRATMVGTEEDRVTYPAFVSLTDGTLLFAYRDGRAGNGDVHLNRLSPGGARWERVAKLIEGRDSAESPYLNHIAVAPGGEVHISGCFRGPGGAAANRDVFHACSEDGGVTWRSAAGEHLDLPLRHETVPVVVPTAERGSGLVNQMGMDVDPGGSPHISYFHYDERGATQIALASHDGDSWRSRDITKLTHRMETDTPIVDASVARPAIACTADGDVWAVYRASYDGRGDRVRCIRCTPGLPLSEFVVYDGGLGAWEPTIDSRALRLRDELHLLVTPAPPYPIGAPSREAAAWAEQPIAVLSVGAEELAAAALAAED